MAYACRDSWAEEAIQVSVAASTPYGNIPPELMDRLLAELHRIRDLRTVPNDSFLADLSNWPLTPVSVCMDQPTVESGSIQMTTHCLRTTILGNGGAIVRFQPSWVQDDIHRFLEQSRCAQADARSLQWRYPTPDGVVSLWEDRLVNEYSTVCYLYKQLRIFLEIAMRSLISRSEWTNYACRRRPAGEGARLYCNNKPDLLFGLTNGFHTSNLSTVLLSGAVKIEMTMTLVVMRQEYQVVLDEPPGLGNDQYKALVILRQVWGQQVPGSVQRLFLTNGNAFIFFAAKPPSRINSYISNFYFHDGRFDPYDGQEIPTAVNLLSVTMPAPWPHAPGLLLALAVSSLLSAKDGQVWDDVPDDDVEELSPALAGPGSMYHSGPSNNRGVEEYTEQGLLRRSNRATGRAYQPITVRRDVAMQGLHRAVSQLFRPSVLAEFRSVDVPTGSADDPTPPLTFAARYLTSEFVPAQTSPSSQGHQTFPSHESPASHPRLYFDSLLGTGLFTDVFGGTLNFAGTLIPCVFKFIHADTFARKNWGYEGRPCSSTTAICTLRNEARVLSRLTGQCIAPEVVGYWEGKDVGGRRYAVLAMEELGPCATAGMSQKDKISVIRLVDKLHDAGQVHGDIELRHVMRTRGDFFSIPGGDHWRLIDFERTVAADAIGANR